MFGNRKSKKFKAGRVLTVIGQGTEVQGSVSFAGGLHVDGVIKGDVIGEHASGAVLSLSELGVIEGEVRVPMAILNGSVVGNVFTSERIELAPKSKVTGNVTYNLIEMAVGAEVNGKLLHQGSTDESMSVNSVVMLETDQKKKSRTESVFSESLQD